MDIHVLGIAGSLRKDSYNRALLMAASTLLPEGMTLEIADIREIPLYDGDVEAQGVPEPVYALKNRIQNADALLIVTPEYNYSIPGVLKNAIDWFSREPDPPLNGKPAAIMGASIGMFGTARSQYHLRQVGVATNMLILNTPQVFITMAKDKFDTQGVLIHEKSRNAVRDLLSSLKAWTLRLKNEHR